MKFYDSHTHLDFKDFEADLDAVLNRAQHVGVRHINLSGTVASGWPTIQKIVQQYQICHAAYGLHPMFMSEHHQQRDLDLLQQWAKFKETIAIGEIGLDYFIPDPDKKAQLNLFIQQLEIAHAHHLPVIIHARKALDLIIQQLRKFPGLQGSIHSFSGSMQQAQQCVDLGFYLGFGGPITYSRATRLRKIVSTIPLQYLLLETDSPDQPDVQHHGERNEPAYLPIIAHEVAKLKQLDIGEVAQICYRNTIDLFKISNSQEHT